MMEFNDILTRLQNGESAEDLAAEFTKSLNDAEAQLKKEKAKSRRLTYGKIMLQGICDYCREIHPDLLPDVDWKEFDSWVNEDFTEALDHLDAMLTMMSVVGKLSLGPVEKPKGELAKPQVKDTGKFNFTETVNFDTILDEWIKKLG